MVNGNSGKRSTSDFIVIVFVFMVAGTMFALTITAVVLALFTDKAITTFFTVILEMMKSLIAVLAGYVAGKSSRNGS